MGKFPIFFRHLRKTDGKDEGRMFFGEYRHAIDAKGRLFIPVKLRAELGERFWVCKVLGKCLQVFTDQSWNDFCARLDTLSVAQARHIKLYFYSGANETQLDAQGRIALTPQHREFASIERNVVIVGNRTHLEIWSESEWDSEQSYLGSEEITRELERLGF